VAQGVGRAASTRLETEEADRTGEVRNLSILVRRKQRRRSRFSEVEMRRQGKVEKFM
jgi:hypothetical protein